MRVRHWFRLDMPLVTAVLLLCALSLVALYSAGGQSMEVLLRQGGRIAFGCVIMVVCARISPVAWARWSPHVYIFVVGLLFIVLFIGVEGKGAQRWLGVGGLRLQPAELMKIAVPMMAAWILTNAPLPPNLWVAAKALAVALLPAALVMRQPDLGTAIFILLAGVLVIFLSGIQWRIIVVTGFVMGAVVIPLLWNLALRDYQRDRILTLFNPQADPLGDGYHTIQSVIAVGSGGLYGKGWLAGTQSRLDFIPERGTDFIFAIFAEEFGFVGALGLLSLYLFVVGRGLFIAFHSADSYARLVGASLSVLIFLHVFVNMGMVTGILPVVGVPLPLLSYGGSSMVALMIAFGLLCGCSQRRGGLNAAALNRAGVN